MSHVSLIAWEIFLIGKNRIQSEKSVVSVDAEAQSLLRQLAQPAVPGELVCAAISRAARRAGLNSSRATKLWYGNAKAILASEMDELRRRAEAARQAGTNGLRERQSAAIRNLEDLERKLAILREELEGAKVAHKGGKVDP